MRKLLWIFVVTASLGGVAAHAMDADTFYRKGLVLQRMGAVAVTSPDLVPLMTEIRSAAASVKIENDRAKARGKPLFCGPAKNQMTPEQLLAEFGRIPAARRKAMSVRVALRDIAIRKYPC